jgi:DNA-binding response OmpR family regulator
MLLLESDDRERAKLTEALEDAGLSVVPVSSIAEVERWPAGDLVITAAERFTAWWKETGATHVLVLASTPEEGAEACARGATMWVLRPCSPEQLVAAVKSILDPDDRPPRRSS